MKRAFIRFKNGNEARYEQVYEIWFDDKSGLFVITISKGLSVFVNKDEILFIEKFTEPEEPDEGTTNVPVEE